MDRLTTLEALVAVVDCGSFSRAAARLGMSPAMMSTHVARLEARLGTRLIDRTTRRLALTRHGHLYVAEARSVLASLAAAEDAVRQGKTTPSGRVLIDAPAAVGMRFLVPALAEFRQANPAIVLDLSVGDRGTTFSPEGFDLLIRIGEPTDARSHKWLLGQTRFVQVASPDYLARKGEPAGPDALLHHEAILYRSVEMPDGNRWRFARDGEINWMRPPSVLTANHGDAIGAAAAAGVGVAQTLEMLVATELESGRLVPILTEWNRDTVPIYLVAAEDRAERPVVMAVSEFIRDRIPWPQTSG
jgi:DNA-binding transcriptional LysR family regulator